jgi:hypothetical protein
MKLPSTASRRLRQHGFVILPGPRPAGGIPQLRRAFDRAAAEADGADISVGSSTRVKAFVNGGPDFDGIYIFPPLLAACCQVIARPFKLSGMRARTLEPCAPMQALHVDVQHQEQVIACGPAGALIVFDGSVWHSHTSNTSAARRRSVQGHFIPCDARASIDHEARLHRDTLERIDDLAKYVLACAA